MTDTPRLTPEQLSKNAQLINAAHRAVVAANKTSIEKAIEAGEMLRACKKSVAHGEWSKWLHDNCGEISEETARLYMRLADEKNAPTLEKAAKQNGNAVADLSVRGAAKLLRKVPTPEEKAAKEAEKNAARLAAAATAATEKALTLVKQLGSMKSVDDVVKLLTSAFDDDFIDTLSVALQKHLDKDAPEEEKAAPAPGAPAAGAAAKQAPFDRKL